MALTFLFLCPSFACAKIGDSVSDFIIRQKDMLTVRGSSTKDGVTYFNFSLRVEDSERQAAPGFGAGSTVTVKQGKIVGQSMAVCLGQDKFMGGQLAGAYGLKFACEAIGRTIPGDRATQDRELEVFNKSANEALAGAAKEIRYKGFDHKIILSASKDGNLLIAVVKNEPQSPPSVNNAALSPVGAGAESQPAGASQLPQSAYPQRPGLQGRTRPGK